MSMNGESCDDERIQESPSAVQAKDLNGSIHIDNVTESPKLDPSSPASSALDTDPHDEKVPDSAEFSSPGNHSWPEVPDSKGSRQSRQSSLLAMRSSRSKAGTMSLDEQAVWEANKMGELKHVDKEHVHVEIDQLEHSLQTLVQSPYFSIVVCLTVLTNSICIGIQADKPENEGMKIADHIFTGIYTAELLIKILAFGKAFFKNSWNLFDLVLVIFGLTDLVLSFIGGEEGSLSNFMVMRLVRLIRIGRVVRLLHMFRELWLLVEAMVASIQTLFWSGIMLMVLLYMCSIFVMDIIRQPLRDGAWAKREGEQEIVEDRFGNLLATMFTLFEMMVSDWGDVARMIMAELPGMAVFFVLFVAITGIAVLNVIVSVIVESTLKKTMHDNEMEKRRFEELERKRHVEVSQNLFGRLVGKDLELTRSKWLRSLEDTNVILTLRELGVDGEQSVMMFDIMDADCSGSLTLSEFITGLQACQRPPKIIDLYGASEVQNKSLREHVEHLERQVSTLTDYIGTLTSQNSQMLQRMQTLEEQVSCKMDQQHLAVMAELKSRQSSTGPGCNDAQVLHPNGSDVALAPSYNAAEPRAQRVPEVRPFRLAACFSTSDATELS